jgi:hypothetical protein
MDFLVNYGLVIARGSVAQKTGYRRRSTQPAAERAANSHAITIPPARIEVRHDGFINIPSSTGMKETRSSAKT